MIAVNRMNNRSEIKLFCVLVQVFKFHHMQFVINLLLRCEGLRLGHSQVVGLGIQNYVA